MGTLNCRRPGSGGGGAVVPGPVAGPVTGGVVEEPAGLPPPQPAAAATMAIADAERSERRSLCGRSMAIPLFPLATSLEPWEGEEALEEVLQAPDTAACPSATRWRRPVGG